jgi:glycine cleavage system aminomethyltransferase T
MLAAEEVIVNNKEQVPATKQSTFELVKEFFVQQGERTRVYSTFEAGFELYMKEEATGKQYQALVAAVGRSFGSISEKV